MRDGGDGLSGYLRNTTADLRAAWLAAADGARRDKTPASVAQAPPPTDPPLFLPSTLAQCWSPPDKDGNITAVFPTGIGWRTQTEEEAPKQKGRSSAGRTSCVCIYWLMNQYGFPYTKRAGCHGEWVSITSTWSRSAMARSPRRAPPHWFVTRGWMKGMTAERYEEYRFI